MEDMKKDAKLKVLEHLKQMASDMMSGDVKDGMDGMKKVSVAAPDKEGLTMGLDKAKELVGGHDESPEEGAFEGKETQAEEDAEDAALSPEEIDAKIAKLQELKKQKTNTRPDYL